jgi:WD40-like Beta Propeller Repeat
VVYLRTTLTSVASLFAFVFGIRVSCLRTRNHSGSRGAGNRDSHPAQRRHRLRQRQRRRERDLRDEPERRGRHAGGRDNDGGDPNWSSDGSKITFVGAEWYIYVMNSDGSNRKRLTASPDFEADPAYRPTGRRSLT